MRRFHSYGPVDCEDHFFVKRHVEDDEITHICKFSSPYVQDILYNVFVKEIKENHDQRVLAIEPTDLLEDVFCASNLDIPALLGRYKDVVAIGQG
jgi:hypothetical protein